MSETPPAGRRPLPEELSPRPPSGRRGRPGWIVAGSVAGVFLMVAGAVVVLFLRAQSAQTAARHRQATTAAAAFLRTWAAGDIQALPALTVSGDRSIAAAYTAADKALGVNPVPPATVAPSSAGTASPPPPMSSNVPVRFTLGNPRDSGGQVWVPADITLQLPGIGPWTYPDMIHVRVGNRHALVDWTPETINPSLHPGRHLHLSRQLPTRAPLLAADGSPLPATDPLADIQGTVGPATAAQAKTDPTVLAGDPVGQSGLQALDDNALRGTPSADVTVLDTTGRTVGTAAHIAGRAPRPVATTVNGTLQAAAEQAIANTGHPSGLVAIDTSTGAVLAAASSPAGYPRATVGHYPPGSTFKMVTLTAALLAGHTLSDPTACTPSVTVNGYTFRNAAGEAFGTISLQQAFAVSCNTAFIHLAETLPPGEMATAARLLGCDTGHAPLPINSYGCSYPASATGTGYAASAIGQGNVLTSPLAIAAIAAAADAGRWQQPHLTPDPAPATHPIPAAVVAGLRQAMRAVVTSGTGTPANLPGLPVYGKTGTAEHGSGPNPPTDAWFAAFRGQVAIAVVVEDAGFGETAAVPVAAKFLADVH